MNFSQTMEVSVDEDSLPINFANTDVHNGSAIINPRSGAYNLFSSFSSSFFSFFLESYLNGELRCDIDHRAI